MDDESNQAEIITLYNLYSSGDAYRTNRMFWMLSLALLVYDAALTLDYEVEFMWRGRFVWTRILYFANRYWPLLNIVFDNIALGVNHSSDISMFSCKFWFNWFLYAYLLSRIIISAILIMRLYVMYRCDRRLLVGLCVLFLLEFATESAIICDVIYSLKVIGLRSQLTGCIVIPTRSWAWAYWVPVLVFESVLFALSVIKTVQQSREDTSTPYLMMVLIRDSMFYFGGALAAILANFIVWKTQKIALFFGLIPLSIVTNSILGCRMLLHIQKAGRHHELRMRHDPDSPSPDVTVIEESEEDVDYDHDRPPSPPLPPMRFGESSLEDEVIEISAESARRLDELMLVTRHFSRYDTSVRRS